MLCLNDTKRDAAPENKKETEEIEDSSKKMEIDSSPPKPNEIEEPKDEKLKVDEKKIRGIGDKYSKDLIKYVKKSTFC